MKHNYLLITAVSFLIFGASINAPGQWVRTNCPTLLPVTCFASVGTNLFAGTIGDFNGHGGDGIFRSSDSGTSWIAVNSSLSENGKVFYIFSLAVSGSNVFAGTYRAGIFLTTDNGVNWAAVNTGLAQYSHIGINALCVSGTNIIAGTDSGIFRSADNGSNWIAVGTGLSHSTDVQSLTVSGTNVFAGTKDSGIYQSSDNGISWVRTGFPLKNGFVYTMVTVGTNLFAGGAGVYFSADSGKNWVPVNSGLTKPAVTALACNGKNLFAGTLSGVFFSGNNGADWSQAGPTLINDTIFSVAISGIDLLAGTKSKGIWRRPLSDFSSSEVGETQMIPSESTLHPNPSQGRFTIGYTVPLAGRVSLEVYNTLSDRVALLLDRIMQPGRYEMTFDTHSLLAGMYYYRVISFGSIETKKFIIAR